MRLQAIGLAEGGAYEFPLTQAELADATGLSTVHVNRTLQELRAAGLITLKGRLLTIRDAECLKALAGFDPGYLHLTPGQGALRRQEARRAAVTERKPLPAIPCQAHETRRLAHVRRQES